MFGLFSKNKADYKNKGQIFPFLIAVICVSIILMMITVNLGQIGIFKTEVSNAADAGALAGASTLSSTLLGLGLRSDMMCGRAIEVLIAIIIELCFFVYGWIMAILTYIVFIVEALVNLAYAYGDARLGWTNAKRISLQYAFNNSGVDEVRPTFEDFLKNAYSVADPTTLSAAQLQTYYDEYSKGATLNTRNYAQTGFSKFVADAEEGYWDEDSMGEINPSEVSDIEVVSGYGWNDYDKGGNSYANGGSYDNYDNWVEVKAIASSQYAIDLWSYLQELSACLINYLLDNMWIPWWLTWMGLPASWIIETFASFLLCAAVCQYVYPMGLQFTGGREDFLDDEGEDTRKEVDENPILVEVARYKRPNNLGLWNFRYGRTKAMRQGHAFRQQGDEKSTADCVSTVFDCGEGSNWFETRQHLFEAELQYAY